MAAGAVRLSAGVTDAADATASALESLCRCVLSSRHCMNSVCFARSSMMSINSRTRALSTFDRLNMLMVNDAIPVSACSKVATCWSS